MGVRTSLVVIGLLLASPAVTRQDQLAAQPDIAAQVELGIKQVDEGNFSEALMTLDSVAQHLTRESARHGPRKGKSKSVLYAGGGLGLGAGPPDSCPRRWRSW